MDIRKLQRAIVDGLEDVKAQNIVVFNTEHLSVLFERVIIASGTSNRQTKSLASSVRETVKSRGLQVMRMEGEDNGEWIIVDCGAAVVHVMQPAIRDYYRLEEIWGGTPVKMKLGGGDAKLPKASEAPEPAAKKKPAAKKAGSAKAASDADTPAKKAALKRAAPAKTAAKAPVKSASKSAAKPAPKAPVKAAASKPVTAKKTVAKKGVVSRTVGVKSGSSGGKSAKVPTLVVGKPATNKAASNRAAAAKRASPAKKPAARKS